MIPFGLRCCFANSRNSADKRLVVLARKFHVVLETIASKWFSGWWLNQRLPSSVMMLTLGLRSTDATSGCCAIKARYPLLISITVSDFTAGLLAITCAHEPDESPIIRTSRGAARNKFSA